VLSVVGASPTTGYSLSVPIPNDPQLNGLQLALQSWILDAGVSPAGLTLSNGLHWKLGR
jgi:hypothetical protein